LSTTIIFWIAFAVLVFWVLGAYNRLVGLRAQLARALQTLAAQWQANAQSLRHELAELSRAPETDSAWASLGDNASSWRPLAQATKQFQACLSAALAKPHTIPPVDDLASIRAAREVMESAWERLRSTHDDLAGEAVPQSLVMKWQHQQLQAEEKLRDYNNNVQIYNQAVRQFPAVLLGWVFGFGVAQSL
jgi:LemA protein